MEYYLYISGAYDQCYVGPFPSRGAAIAAATACHALSSTLDYEVHDELERKADVERYGDLPLFHHLP